MFKLFFGHFSSKVIMLITRNIFIFVFFPCHCRVCVLISSECRVTCSNMYLCLSLSSYPCFLAGYRTLDASQQIGNPRSLLLMRPWGTLSNSFWLESRSDRCDFSRNLNDMLLFGIELAYCHAGINFMIEQSIKIVWMWNHVLWNFHRESHACQAENKPTGGFIKWYISQYLSYFQKMCSWLFFWRNEC